MKTLQQLGMVILGVGFMELGFSHAIARADQGLFLTYPPEVHQTTAEQIFLIGTAAPEGEVLVNGESIQRNVAGHFAPSFPLQVGDNTFTLRYGDQEKRVVVTRLSTGLAVPDGVAFVPESLMPTVDIARLPGELICFEAIAPPNAAVSVSLGTHSIPLSPEPPNPSLPPNYSVLTFDNQPTVLTNANDSSGAMLYQGCRTFTNPGLLGAPTYRMVFDGQTVQTAAAGTVEIFDPNQIQVVEVTAESGTARTGPSTHYSRLTPLPPGTRARLTGREGEWFRMDYGAWIRGTKAVVQGVVMPPRSLIRSVQMRQGTDRTEMLFPLQVPVPISVDQGSDTFSLTLHNTTAQTDTILLNDDLLVERMDWTQPNPDEVTYRFTLKTQQQWGYDIRYEGTTLVLVLHHPPALRPGPQPLQGMRILLDPGHGGPNDLGARGPTGYPEKDVALDISLLLRDELEQRGATVIMSRTEDVDVGLGDRVNLIQSSNPHLALSVHYNALPDNGDAINTAGIGTFWYNAQAHRPAVVLHNYLVETLGRPSYGVFWNNLALTRPTTAPSVLLELGFMINPDEFEWVIDPVEQQRLANALADGILAWVNESQ
ncbi:MAG: N-acetylmuramoyl-L-alanine amidase [Merismopedia sp. SIO2A8]|nr:N-acetylmuramoyl-L-alanine amidase [Merismopedia sp. SIO2A8]